jgi:hypothetical protein
MARVVAARLVAWLRWPGRAYFEAVWNVHPLDKTPVAELRALIDEPVWGDEEPDDLTGALRRVLYYELHWPTLAVITDYLTQSGMWSEIHKWRPTTGDE